MTTPERTAFILERLPSDGLFADKTWRISPEAFPLSASHTGLLTKLGPALLQFTRACNLLYRQSVRGKQPAWIAELLDRGKPPELIALSRRDEIGQEMPRVLRPDLILTETGFGLSEIDSIPGGIGLTAWLQETYAELGEAVIGGSQGMRTGFNAIFPQGDILIATEGLDYWPEFVHLAGTERVQRAETYARRDRPIYRFFEAFDAEAIGASQPGLLEQPMTPPLKPYLEEKLWLALFWLRPLQSFWRRELGDKTIKFLQEIIPYSWLVDPTPLPPHAVLPGLEVNAWEEVGQFSQKERELILKISGFSAEAWGARGVYLGQDMSSADWQERLRHALDSFPHHPYLLQRFVKGALVEQPYASEGDGFASLRGRARVCPYYFVTGESEVTLGGVLVTLCPADKKLLHGMKDAILSPAKMA